MLRVITEFNNGKRTILSLCDVSSCGQTISCDIPVGVEVNAAIDVFLNAGTQGGWAFSMVGQLCPGHVQKTRQQKNLVEVVPSLSVLQH